MIEFTVYGCAVPKQSFRYDGNGRGHTDPRAKSWAGEVARASGYSIDDKLCKDIRYVVQLTFCLPDEHRRDLDNLSKNVLDALNGRVWKDDTQIIDLHVIKSVDRFNPRVEVSIKEAISD